MVLKNSYLVQYQYFFFYFLKNKLKGVNEAECHFTLRSILWYIKMPITFVPLTDVWERLTFLFLDAFVIV